MEATSIESLLEAANSSPTNNTSVNFAKRVFLDDDECQRFFETARANLFDINEWKKNSSATDYALFEENGEECGDPAISIGRFIRINLYGGGKYDWVRVISIKDDPDEVIITVKPTFDASQPHDDADELIRPSDRLTSPSADAAATSPSEGGELTISHFFGPEATNNFCLQRHEKTLAFYVIGLNENQNTAFTAGLIESARNAAVANVGYYSGLQKAVWKEFASNFLRTEQEKES